MSDDTTVIKSDPIITHDQPAFSEAPYSGNVRARIRGYDWQLTIRASANAEFVSKINGVMAWLDKNTDKAINVEPPQTVTAPAPVTAPVAPQAASGIQSIRISKISVTPRADGKSNIKFFADGHQYPDLYTTRTPAQLVALLSATGQWTEKHFQTAAEYNVPMMIDYTLSEKKNSKGNPYKDIVTIAPATK